MKKNIKYLAVILILSLILPFFPSVNASADISPMPEFPYGQDSFYNVNSGSFALWQVHNSTHISYIQTYTPNNINSPDPIIIFNETWLSSNNTYYIDYNYIIDSWDINGLHLDGYPINKNVRVPRPKEDYVEDNVVYATLVFTTDDIWWKNSGGSGIYAYTNYYSSGYADPTPTSIPRPVIGAWNSYPDLPSNFSSQTLCILKYHSNDVNDGKLIGLASSGIGSSCQFNYPIFYKDRRPYNFNSQALCDGGITINTWSNSWNFSVFTVNYDENSNTYSVGGNLHNSSVTSPSADAWFLSTAYFWRGETIACWSVIPNNSLVITNIDGTTIEFGSEYFEILFTNKNYVPGSNINPNVTSTPTPTAIPTAIPQPTDNPNPSPTTPPDVKVVQPSEHWWDGLVNPIKYIFVPSSDKMMRTYNTFANKFGVQKPTKFEFDANALLRPDNITWKFKHVSLDGNDNTITEITLVDFQMIDGWLDSSAGQFIIGIVRAVFTLLMWGYLIYIFQKHIATINYTDAHTLIEQSRKGGDSDD